MSEYIDKNTLHNTLYQEDAITMKGITIINNLPASDVAPIKHEYWMNTNFDFATKKCSGCGYTIDTNSLSKRNYCPNCGSKMDKEIKQHYCVTCKHFIGCGDWDLCCDLPHPEYPCGFLCYEDTLACDQYEEGENRYNQFN